MGLGAFPAADPQWLGMLGMHGTYEANMAMHDCDVMICIGARFDDRVTGRLDAFSPGSKKIHVDIDPSSINKNVHVDVPIVGDARTCCEDMVAAVAHRARVTPTRRRWPTGGSRSTNGARASRSPIVSSNEVIKPQYAIQRLYELTKDRDIYITTEVGQHQMWAAQYYQLRGAQPLDDLAAGSAPWATACRPRSACRWRIPKSLVIDIAGEASRADDHAGDVDRGAVPAADQDLHPQQPVHGHGAPVAGTAAWRALFAKAIPRRCRISSSWRRPMRAVGIRCEKPGELDARDQGDDRRRPAGAVRLRGRSEGELLPDDPVGRARTTK